MITGKNKYYCRRSTRYSDRQYVWDVYHEPPLGQKAVFWIYRTVHPKVVVKVFSPCVLDGWAKITGWTRTGSWYVKYVEDYSTCTPVLIDHSTPVLRQIQNELLRKK